MTPLTLRIVLGRMFVAADVLLAPFVWLAAMLLRRIRLAGVQRMPAARAIFRSVGMLPVTDHYFDPWPTASARPGGKRALPGIEWNLAEQLALLEQFKWQCELKSFPLDGPADSFHFRNGTFGAGDAEVLYSLIRLRQPARLIEIGGGNSTLIAAAAIRKNRETKPAWPCEHICIEPYENPWLEKSGAQVLRRTLETVDRGIFGKLQRDDMLFIDSSHVIRPGGDVLTLYLDVLPRLASGVLVHAHDIFTPRDYPARWTGDAMLLWNEQYLVEAFLAGNRDFRVTAALNMLYYDHRKALEAACPVLAAEGGPEPGSLWMMRN